MGTVASFLLMKVSLQDLIGFLIFGQTDALIL
jgi:hypothetical protein